MDIYFTLWVVIKFYHYLLIAEIFSILAIRLLVVSTVPQPWNLLHL